MAERVVPAPLDPDRFGFGDPVAYWFATEAFRIDDTAELVKQTGERLHGAGIPLFRLSYFQRTLHPELLGAGFFWRRGQGVQSQQALHTIIDDPEYSDNPLTLVFDQGKTVRVRLESNPNPGYPLLRQLQEEGASDYCAMPIVFSDGHLDALSVTADGPGGFSRAHLDRMYGLSFMFARIVEIHNRRQTAINLLDTYVGHDAGVRVLDGHILRGDGATLRAVIWYCDLRDFTPLSDRLPREALIDMLNDYFGVIGEAVGAAGGEILKFVGDAVLAIFPVEGDEVAAVCARAMAAARAAFAAAELLNRDRQADGRPLLRFGLALHIGDVMYGNVGAPGRLDFTVIGPTVNQVARLEKMTKGLGRRIVLSETVAAALGDAVEPLGTHMLTGVAEPQAIFGVPALESAPEPDAAPAPDAG